MSMSDDEEFQESEILFRESADVEDIHSYDDGDFPVSSGWRETREMIEENSSVPINIPGSANVSKTRTSFGSDGGTEEFVPPHVIIGRRVAEKLLALSLCAGKGKALKGRDLIEFRNRILRMTGFLDG